MRSFPSSADVAREAELEKQELKRKRTAHEVSPLSFPRQVGGGSEKQTVDAITSCVGFGLFADSGLLLGQLARALS